MVMVAVVIASMVVKNSESECRWGRRDTNWRARRDVQQLVRMRRVAKSAEPGLRVGVTVTVGGELWTWGTSTEGIGGL